MKQAKLLASQKLILAELDKEFGKAGAAAGTGFAADISRANDAIDDAKISIAQGLMPALGEVAREISKTFKDPQVTQGLKDLGTGIGDVIKCGVAFAKTVPWDKIASALGTAAGFAKDLLNAFLGLPTWVQTAVITGWGLNKLTGGFLTDLASGLIKGVLGINAGVVNINAATVVGGGGVPVPAGGPPGFSPTAQGTGGLSGLIKGIPIIGAALAGAEFANIAAPVIADKIKGVTPEVSSGIASGATTAIIGALTGPLGFPNLISGIQTIAGNIGALIPLIDAQPKEDVGGKITSLFDRFPGEIGAAVETAGAQRDAETSSQIASLIAAQGPITKTSDVQALQAVTENGLSTVSIDTINAGNTMSDAARAAGVTASNGAYGAASGVIGAIQANRPITNVFVDVVATTVQKVVDVVTRYGPPGGDRDSSDRNRYG